jgi:homocysteine S-methyltransferase
MVSALSGDVPILVCVAPLRSFEEADYLSHEVPDIGISGHTLAVMERAGPDQERTGLELAASLLAQARPLVRGAVLTLPGAGPAALDLLLGALS